MVEEKYAMARFHWTGCLLRKRLSLCIEEEWFVFRLTLHSLFYNSLTSCMTILDTALEPMFCFVERFIRYLGPIFVVLVVGLTTSVVVIVYTCLLPMKLSYSYFWAAYHLIVGHWLLVNIVYNYFKAAFTSPGFVPQQVPVSAGICKKCISPKPPRAHHCTVCDRCVLKMDHHCPWLNNCVGHFNHRYFFLFCTYMWIGCMYVSVLAYPMFQEHFLGSQVKGWTGILYPIQLGLNFFSYLTAAKSDAAAATKSPAVNTISQPQHHANDSIMHNVIAFEFLLCSAACFALGGLLLWHMRLISRGETSIEMHTNRVQSDQQKKLGLVYRNPYNFGCWENWRLFLGLTHGRTFWRHILFPSAHVPEGDGLTWHMAHDYTTRLKDVVVL